MNLLKTIEDWHEWNEIHKNYPSEDLEKPLEFPCYVYKVVSDWGMQEEQPVYVYMDTLKLLTQNMKTLSDSTA